MKEKLKKPSEPFIHLHVHTEKSFKDGYSSIDDILSRLDETEQPGIAVTDHGFMYDSLANYLKARGKNKKYIFGCELYVVPEGNSANLPKSINTDDGGDNKKEKLVSAFHLVVLATSMRGLENLHKLVSIANDCGYDKSSTDHFYYNPRIKREDLAKYSEDLVVLSACLGGEISTLLKRGKDSEAIKVAKLYKKMFGENYYLELQDHSKGSDVVDGQVEVNKKLIALSKKLDIPLILTNDTHYTWKEDYEKHKLLKCIAYNEDYYDAKNYDTYYPTNQFYIKSDDEMWKVACKYGEYGRSAYKNTFKIFEQCNVDIKTELHFPPAKFDRKKFKNADEYLRHLTYELVGTKYDVESDEYESTIVPLIEKELNSIEIGQFPDYFLNTYDIVKYSKDNDILIGAGRGSAGGSIVSNILNITDIDPITFELIFERFWHVGRSKFAYKGDVVVPLLDSFDNKKKKLDVKYKETGEVVNIKLEELKVVGASPPDIDIDIPSNRREEVIDFVKEHFGLYKVANIITFGTYKARAVVNGGCKALGVDDSLQKKISACLPWKGSPSLSECLGSYTDKKGNEVKTDLQELCDSDPEVDEIIEKLLWLEGRSTHAGTHAAGVIITDEEFFKYTPIFNAKNGFTAQYSYESLESIGVLKVDLLGHEAEVVIDNACMLIEKNHGVKINPYDIPMDDKDTFEQVFKKCRMRGIPQLNSDWHIPIIRDVFQKDPEEWSIEDIVALVTMIRPGSMDSGQTDKYREGCLGYTTKPDVPELTPIVDKYKNCLLYQEQIMFTAQQLGEFDLQEADELRKVCAKTKYAHLAEPMMEKLETRMLEHGIPKKNVKRIIEIVKDFFKYSFNKAHGAGYGVTSYRIAYLKTHYFLELTTAQLNSVIGKMDKTAEFIEEVIERGYKILPPDVNKSDVVWTCDDKGIYCPLNIIDGVGPACVNTIVEERELHGEYKDFIDFAKRTPRKSVNKKAILHLNCVGAFTSMGYTRNTIYENYEALLDNLSKGKTLFGNNPSELKPLKEYEVSDIITDEENLLGFRITYTDKELKAYRAELSKKFDELENGSERAKNERKQKADKYSDDGSGKKSEPKKKDKDKIARLKALRDAKRKEKEKEESEGNDEESDDAKSSLKDKLNLKKKKPKKEVVIEDDQLEDEISKFCIINLKELDGVLSNKVTKLLAKARGDKSDYVVCIDVELEDGNTARVQTNTFIKANKQVLLKLQLIVGKKNVELID